LAQVATHAKKSAVTTSRDFAPLDMLRLCAVPVIWGVNNVAAMVAVRELPPLWVAALRFGIVLMCLFWALRAPPPNRLWLFLAMLACVGPAHFGVQYVGLGLAHDLAPMVVAMQLWAPASVMFAAFVLGERAGLLRWSGVAIAFAGVAGMTFDPIVFAQWGALALVSLASCAYGMGAVLVRRLSGAMDPWAMQAWIALSCAPTLAIASLTFERGHIDAMAQASGLAWAAILFGAIISSIVANAFMFRLVQTYEVSRTTPYMLVTPVISFTLAALVLGDEITPRILIGAGLAMAGVALVALAERRRV
jgi:O-acetylserine/cysteine efflux transporter